MSASLPSKCCAAPGVDCSSQVICSAMSLPPSPMGLTSYLPDVAGLKANTEQYVGCGQKIPQPFLTLFFMTCFISSPFPKEYIKEFDNYLNMLYFLPFFKGTVGNKIAGIQNNPLPYNRECRNMALNVVIRCDIPGILEMLL